MLERGNNFEPICSVTIGWKKVFWQRYFDDGVFLSPLSAFKKIILSKHF